MENAFCVAIDLKIFTMNVLIPETLHTAFYDLFWVPLLGFGLDGSYKQNSVGEMIFWTAFSFPSLQPLICWFLATVQ